MLFCNLSYALGLGDIELKSHLNEALSARITLAEVESTIDPGCFTATDAGEIGAFKKAYVTLKKTNGLSHLNIITYDLITEPIVNLLVTFHCDPTINREYVLLMDPAPIVSSEVATTAVQSANASQAIASAPKSKRRSPKSQIEPSLDNALPSTDVATEKPVNKKRKKARATTVDEKLAEAYTGKSATEVKVASQAQPQPAALIQPNTEKPYLVISGGNTEISGNNQSNLSLRMETQIDFSRNETIPPSTTAEEADEVTVMSNRLAHLEKQILSLQAKNIQLSTENDKIKNESISISPALSEWLQRILIGFGIIAVLAVAELLRRKIMLNRLHQDEAVWFDAQPENNDDLLDSKNINAAIFNEPTFDNSFATQVPNEFSSPASMAQIENGEVENVIEHADVFIEHGRPALAIQLLQTFLEDAPAESLSVWLKLLNLLAKEGSESDYEFAINECNQFFNIKMPNFADAVKPDNSTIEDHPHIISRLEGVWGSQYVLGFLNDLIYNQQSQPREGFERNTFEELFFLKQIATLLQSNNPSVAAAYKPEIVNPLLDNAEINQTLFAANEASANTHESDAGALDENRQQYEPTNKTPAYNYEDRFAESDYTVDISNTVVSDAEVDAIEDGFSQQAYDIDIVLDTQEVVAEPSLSEELDFEAIDFNVSTEEITSTELRVLPVKAQPDKTEVVKTVPETGSDFEESDADSISKYLSRAEEKAKNPKPSPNPAKDSNVIEFDWDLPSVD